MPTVSIVMPLYNTEDYVSTAIQSVLAQTFDDFELIIVDDGSTDGSVEICRRFRDKRIRLIRQRNRGLAGARNTGIRNAMGNYIALLDADDAWSPTKLARQVTHLRKRPLVGVSYCQSAFMDDKGTNMGIVQKPKLRNISPADILCRNPVGNGSAAVIRKTVFDAIAYNKLFGSSVERCYFDEDLRQSEDIECWLRIANQTAWQFEGIAEPLTFYRVNAGGLSANLEKQFQSWLLVRNKVARYAPNLIARYGRLAESFQLRYLARRAIQSRDAGQALRYSLRALGKDWRMSLREPLRTTVTLACSLLLNLLPISAYQTLEQGAMQGLGLWRRLRA